MRLIGSNEAVLKEHFQDFIDAGRFGGRNVWMRAVNDEAGVRIVLLKAHVILGKLPENVVLLYVERKAEIIQHRDSMITLNFLGNADQKSVMTVLVRGDFSSEDAGCQRTGLCSVLLVSHLAINSVAHFIVLGGVAKHSTSLHMELLHGDHICSLVIVVFVVALALKRFIEQATAKENATLACQL